MPKKISGATERIMAGCRKQLKQGGREAVNVRSLMKACGMGTSTFYRYFRSRDDLIARVMEEDWNALLLDIDASLTQERPLYDRVRYFYDKLRSFESDYRFSAVGGWGGADQFQPARETNSRRLCRRLAQLLREDSVFQDDAERAAGLLFRLAVSEGAGADFDGLWECLHRSGSEADRTRKQSESEWLRRIIDNVPAGIGVTVFRGNQAEVIFLNRKLMEMLDISAPLPGEYTMGDMRELIHPHDQARCRADVHHFLEGDGELNGTYRFLRKSTGEYFWLHVEGRLTDRPDGSRAAFLSYTDVDQPKKAESALRSSRRAYEAAAAATGVSVWEYDVRSHTIRFSDESSRQDMGALGLDREIGNVPESILKDIDEEDREHVLEMYRQVESGQDAGCELWTRPADPGEERRCYRVLYTVERDESGRALRAYGLRQDVTAHKKAEERYERELANLRSTDNINLIAKGRHNLTRNKIMEYIPMNDKSHVIPADQTYDDACAAFAKMPYLEEDRKKLKAMVDRNTLIRAYRNGETHFSFQYCRTQDRNMPSWITTVINTYQAPETSDIECFIYSYDITEKILKDQIIARLSTLGFDELGLIYPRTGVCTVYQLDTDAAKTAEHSAAYADILAELSERCGIPGQRETLLRALSVETITAEVDRTGAYTYAFPVRNGGGTQYKQFQFSWMDEGKSTVFCCLNDITKQTEEEQKQIGELQEAKLEADRANEAKSMFLSSMSHDLRTPLNGIIGFADIALREPDPEKKQDYLFKIKSSGDLLLNLVNDTLELSRIESGKAVLEPEVVDSIELGQAVVTALRPSAELKHTTLEAEPEQFVRETVWIDKLKVQKIFLNLIANAIKFTPDGGTVRASVLPLEPELKGCNRRIIVEDNGVGISPEFLPHVFEPFSQEHLQSNVSTMGTGLGLAIVKRITDLIGGTVHVQSELGKGTRFTVDIPVKSLAMGAREKKTEAENYLSLAGKRVLLCEDNYLNTEIATILLREQDIIVDCAANGREGAEKFAASPEHYYDAVLMDIRMPILDGYGAARDIRALPRADAGTVPIIAMTADAFEEDVRRAKDVGMNDYVTKPVEPEKLMSALKRCVTRKAGTAPAFRGPKGAEPREGKK